MNILINEEKKIWKLHIILNKVWNDSFKGEKLWIWIIIQAKSETDEHIKKFDKSNYFIKPSKYFLLFIFFQYKVSVGNGELQSYINSNAS